MADWGTRSWDSHVVGFTIYTFIIYHYARTRLSNDAKSAEKGVERQFNGLVDVCKKTLASDGIAGVYRGFILPVAGIVVYYGMCFGAVALR